MNGGMGHIGETRGFLSGWFDFGASLTLSAKVVLLILGVGGLLLLWQFAPRSESMQTLLPSLSQTVATMGQLFTEKDFGLDVVASIKRIAISFAIAAAIALPLGILMGSFPAVEGLLNPVVSPLRYLPAPSFIPLLLALLGTGDEQKIALLIIGVVWFLISLVMDNTKRVPMELVEASRTLGAPPRRPLLRTSRLFGSRYSHGRATGSGSSRRKKTSRRTSTSISKSSKTRMKALAK